MNFSNASKPGGKRDFLKFFSLGGGKQHPPVLDILVTGSGKQKPPTLEVTGSKQKQPYIDDLITGGKKDPPTFEVAGGKQKPPIGLSVGSGGEKPQRFEQVSSGGEKPTREQIGGGGGKMPDKVITGGGKAPATIQQESESSVNTNSFIDSAAPILILLIIGFFIWLKWKK